MSNEGYTVNVYSNSGSRIIENGDRVETGEGLEWDIGGLQMDKHVQYLRDPESGLTLFYVSAQDGRGWQLYCEIRGKYDLKDTPEIAEEVLKQNEFNIREKGVFQGLGEAERTSLPQQDWEYVQAQLSKGREVNIAADSAPEFVDSANIAVDLEELGASTAIFKTDERPEKGWKGTSNHPDGAETIDPKNVDAAILNYYRGFTKDSDDYRVRLEGPVALDKTGRPISGESNPNVDEIERKESNRSGNGEQRDTPEKDDGSWRDLLPI